MNFDKRTQPLAARVSSLSALFSFVGKGRVDEERGD